MPDFENEIASLISSINIQRHFCAWKWKQPQFCSRRIWSIFLCSCEVNKGWKFCTRMMGNLCIFMLLMNLVFVFLSNQSSTANFEALSHGTNNVNANPCNNMEGSNMNNSNSEVFPTWYQAFTSLSSTDLLSAFSLQPHSQQDAVKVLPLFRHLWNSMWYC